MSRFCLQLIFDQLLLSLFSPLTTAHHQSQLPSIEASNLTVLPEAASDTVKPHPVPKLPCRTGDTVSSFIWLEPCAGQSTAYREDGHANHVGLSSLTEELIISRPTHLSRRNSQFVVSSSIFLLSRSRYPVPEPIILSSFLFFIVSVS